MSEGFVYFAKSGDLIKIGYSERPDARIWSIPSPTADEIRLALCPDRQHQKENCTDNLRHTDMMASGSKPAVKSCCSSRRTLARATAGFPRESWLDKTPKTLSLP
jgi:hypothetical protein